VASRATIAAAGVAHVLRSEQQLWLAWDVDPWFACVACIGHGALFAACIGHGGTACV
jgi:hypothetical protein